VKLNSRSKIILFVGVYTFASEAVNQYTTLEGVLHGGIENDSRARYLFATVGIGGETIAPIRCPISSTRRDLLPRHEMETRGILAEKIAVVGCDHMSSPNVNSCSREQLLYRH